MVVRNLFTGQQWRCRHREQTYGQGRRVGKEGEGEMNGESSTEASVSSVQPLRLVWLFGTPWTAAHQLLCQLPNPRASSNSRPPSWWHIHTISSTLFPFSSCIQSFPLSGSFPRSQFFISGSQSIGVSDSASVLPMNGQDWYPLGWTGWISL